MSTKSSGGGASGPLPPTAATVGSNAAARTSTGNNNALSIPKPTAAAGQTPTAGARPSSENPATPQNAAEGADSLNSNRKNQIQQSLLSKLLQMARDGEEINIDQQNELEAENQLGDDTGSISSKPIAFDDQLLLTTDNDEFGDTEQQKQQIDAGENDGVDLGRHTERYKRNQYHKVKETGSELIHKGSFKQKLSKVVCKQPTLAIEAQRIINVMDEVEYRMRILDLIPYILNSTDIEIARVMDESLITILTGFRATANAYLENLERAAFLQDDKVEDTFKIEDVYAEEEVLAYKDDVGTMKTKLEQQLRSTFRDLVRLFRVKPGHLSGLLEYQRRTAASTHAARAVDDDGEQIDAEADPYIGKYRQLLRIWQLVRDLMIQRLLVSPAEERARTTFVDNIIVVDEQHMVDIARLTREKQEAIQRRTEEVQAADAHLRKLQKTIHEIFEASANSVRKKWDDVDAAREHEKTYFAARCKDLEQQLRDCRQQLEKLRADNRKDESRMRDEKLRFELEVQTVIQKYDQDMTTSHAKWILLKRQYQLEKQKLLRFEERILANTKRYNDILAYRKRKAEETEQQRQEELRRHAAAIIIQRNWRRYLRERPPGKKKKKGGKGKKEKGGKKKKKAGKGGGGKSKSPAAKKKK